VNRKIELLAPAGNAECLRAAVRAGADAVYLGLGEFNARRNADNFTIDDLRTACEYAHLRGVRVYVTLNIAILPSEVDNALSFARDAYLAGADAFIIQDIGLASRLAKAVPGARLHISTQMNTHSAAGIEAAARLGAKRITLARELSVREISELRQVADAFGIEVETFAHGALCICYSGQCLMSSLIGGRSANRGLCAQACRLPYELHNDKRADALPSEGEHLLSPRDLCSIDLLPELVGAGVSSLKIEGRMKSADYVYSVVSVYRAVLDRVLAAGSERPSAATDAERAQLAEAFSRGFTTAYLTNERGNEIMSYGRPNNRGVFVGRVSAVRDDVAEIIPERSINVGDVLEFWTNRGHFAETVDDATPGKSGAVRIRVSQRTGKGDRVFRVRNAASAYIDDEFEPRVPVDGRVTAKIGKPLAIEFTLADGSYYGFAQGDVVESARTKSISEQDVREHVDRLGQTPFVLDHLDVVLDEGVGMGFSQLHKVRSVALEQLKESMLSSFVREETAQSQLAPTVRGESRFAGRKTDTRIVAWATNPACARAAKRAGADAVYVPVLNYRRGQAAYAGVRTDEADQAGYPKKCVMALPAVDHDSVDGARETTLDFDMWDYVKEDRPVYADNLADCVRAAALGAQVQLGSHVPVTNKLSLDSAKDMGAGFAWLSPELSLGQIADLAEGSQIELGLTIIGSQELMVTEHCLLMSQGPCNQQCAACPRRSVAHHYVDRKGFKFPIVTDAAGRSHLYNGVQLDIVANVPDLMDIGLAAFMVDTTLMDKDGAYQAVARAVKARDRAAAGQGAVPKKPGTTSGHLFRGVS
jgi:U32 family peptidase